MSLVFDLALGLTGRAARERLLAAARNPARAQAEALSRILGRLAPTALGRDLGVGAATTPDAFRAKVPIHDYEALRPYVDRQIAGETAMTTETPLVYTRTSGTTGEPKHIPVTPTTLAELKRAQRVMAYAQHRACPLFKGRILALGGAAREDQLPGGAFAGSATGLIYESMPAFIRAKYVVPPEVFAIEDAELKYAAVTRLALQHEDLTAVSTANPSTFLRLRDWSRANWPTALREMAAGTFEQAEALPPAQAEAVRRAILRRPDRARQLDALAQIAEPTVQQLWPTRCARPCPPAAG